MAIMRPLAAPRAWSTASGDGKTLTELEFNAASTWPLAVSMFSGHGRRRRVLGKLLREPNAAQSELQGSNTSRLGERLHPN